MKALLNIIKFAAGLMAVAVIIVLVAYSCVGPEVGV
jgi:hypothetical protein